MVRMAAEHGTTALVATPHANLDYTFEPELIAERLAQVSDAAGNVLRLYSGCDFHLMFENIEDALNNPSKYTINHKNYLLVEFSDLMIFQNTPEIFSRLASAGMIPIVTHPERNALLRQRLDQIESWVTAGATVQVTGQSLIGNFGSKAQKFCRELLDRGLVQFVASDAHDCQRRPPRMDQARAWLVENYGESAAEVLCEINPGATLKGDPLEVAATDVARQSRKWYRFWR